MSNFKIIISSSDSVTSQALLNLFENSDWAQGHKPEVKVNSYDNALEWLPALSAFHVEPIKDATLIFAYSGELNPMISTQLANYKSLAFYAMRHHAILRENAIQLPESMRINHQNDYETLQGLSIQLRAVLGMMNSVLEAQKESHATKLELLNMLQGSFNEYRSRSSELHDMFSRGAITSDNLLKLTRENQQALESRQNDLNVKLEDMKARFSSKTKECEAHIESILKTVRAGKEAKETGINPEIWTKCEQVIQNCLETHRQHFGQSSPAPRAPGAAGFFSPASSSTPAAQSGPVYDSEDSDIEIVQNFDNFPDF
ncbi:hypothetical protein [Legionella sp. CNM-4043-24]|uniref:hypothetical protein n=1 Tax=Legionella sp. CNM-4043-24 TaxID=3421646 RepID=UPI00403B104E